VFGTTFFPWPQSPTGGDMKIYPVDGSWEEAERISENLMKKVIAPDRYRVLYTSVGYMGCRAGAYDNWAWRNMGGSRISITPSFADYVLWELNGWVGRDIFDAFYVDDSYAMPIGGTHAVLSGLATRLPDGGIQPGLHLWGHRELMKRWRTLMAEHGKRPMIMPHHTHYWLYPGFVFAESTLDGEGAPTVTYGKTTFIDRMVHDQARWKVMQNQQLWGVSRTFMPSIWGYGPLRKGECPHSGWAWRMARGAQGILAHFENHATFHDEGGSVYGAYWRKLEEWGGLPNSVEFVPFYNADPYLSAEGQGKDVWVSFYRDGKRVLFIVTNLLKKERTVNVTLDVGRLGLNAPLQVTNWDADYEPRGPDPIMYAKKVGKPKLDEPSLGLLGESMSEFGLDADQVQLEDPEITARREAAEREEAHRVKLNGNTLQVPLRSHDFRVISLE
jgi:hypothetical protein